MENRKPGTVFYTTFLMVIALVLWGAIAPSHLNSVSGTALNWMNANFSWFYMLTTTLLVFACFFFGFGPYRKIKLGPQDAEPDYSFFTWLGLLFAGGMGVGLVFWGTAEPILHYINPPPGYEAETPEAARTALMYSAFHWALHPWAIYAIVGLALAYFKFRKNRPSLISHAFYPLLRDRVDGPTGIVINVIATCATAIGIATTFGLSALQVSGGMSEIFPVPNNTTTQLIVIGVITVLFIISALSGVDKGISYASIANLFLALILMIAVLVLGPTAFLLENFTTTIGQYLGNFLDLSFSLAPYSDRQWYGQWTIFFWAWLISWAPFVGTFIARVSRGRTIQEFMLGVLIVPSVLGVLWFVIFGGTALNMQINGITDIAGPTQKNEELALFLMLQNLPGGLLLSIMGLILIVIFFITSAASASYVMSVLSSKGTLAPRKSVNLAWGILISATAAVLLLSGGLQALRAVAIITALPFAIVILVMIISLIKELREEVKGPE